MEESRLDSSSSPGLAVCALRGLELLAMETRTPRSTFEVEYDLSWNVAGGESFCVTVCLCGGGLVITTPMNDECG